MDVGGWLRGLGLGQYEETFRDNEIDADLLPRLTDAGLKDIGVSALGHRLRLLDAIAALGAAAPSTSAARPPKPAPPTSPELAAERRPITVMFCDLVGSTSLAAKLDAEDWRNLVNAYLDEATKAVTGLGGHVLKRLGDGLMALFGYPQAQENDAERAVRAALAIQRALGEINARNSSKGAPELSARTGIESGPVVVEATEEVFGEAPNVAARVQAAAEAGSVLITRNVQRQVAGLFVVEEKGAHELKGVAQPLSLYRVVRASGGGRRGGARALTSFVGREEDIGTLLRRWDRVRAGDGQFVQIVGEPGLGKSRLVEEFHSRLGETPHTWVEWNSSQLLQNTPLHPIAEWGRARFGGQDVAAESRLADLETTLAQVKLDVQETATLLAPLLDIPLPVERAPKFGPEELRRRQLAAMVALLLAGARTQPVVLAFEDLHWADPTSLDLIQALAERGAQAPLLVVATTRPEFHAPWGMRSHHAVLALAPLDRTEVRRMVGEIVAQHALPQEVVERVSERTGGVPLFVEEVTRLLLERGEEGGAHAIPPTLQQSLAARLDRLGEACQVAQIGAVLGRDFAYALLRAVGEVDDPTLESALDRLADADLLIAEGAGHGANYRFKHALIQDAAYESLLKSRRQAVHRRAAEILRAQPERAAAESEVIAHHFTQAGLDDLAIEWWGKAGDQALRRSAFQEAISHLGKAIAMADKADGGKAACDSGGRAQFHVAYGNALFAVRGQGAPETTEAFARARERAGGDKDVSERLAADYGLWAGSYRRGELSAMRAYAETFLGDVGARPDSPEAGVAHRTAGITHWFAGEYREAREHLEQALALFQPGRDVGLAFRFGFLDWGVGAMALLPMALWPLGDIERAVSLELDADARNVALPHAGARAHGKGVVAMFELMRGDLSRAASNGVELVRLAREHDLSLVLGLGVFLEGVATAESGAPADGLEQMRRGELLRGTNFPSYDGVIKIALAQAEARAGDVDRAIAVLDEALATVQRTGCSAFEAELNRVRGEMLLKRDPASPAPAEEAFRTAVAIARQQGTRSFELRAALALAKLYQSTGRPADAHAVLGPALEGFSPTPEMPEIAETQALLATLSEAEEVKAEAAQRQRRLQLQTGYAQAVAFSKGFLAEETKAAFERASELAGHDGGGRERFGAYYGRWIVSLTREQLAESLAIAREFLKAAESEGSEMEAAAACRALGLSHFVAGDFRSAQMRLEQAMRLHSPLHDDESRRLFGFDPQAGAMAYLACVNLVCGQLSTGRELIDAAVSRVSGLDHLPTRANTLLFKAIYEAMRGDPEATLAAGNALVAICRPVGLSLYLTCGEACVGWARARGGELDDGTAALRRSRARLIEQGGLAFSPFFAGLLAGLEAEGRRLDAASALVEETLAKAAQTGSHFSDSMLMRLRGDILFRCNPANRAPIEEAFRSAIAIAREQGARSHLLLTSLDLAKLCQSAGRLADAHAVLAPALERFSPTPEMPQIGEAQALLTALEETDEVKAAEAQRQLRLHLQTQYGQAMMWAKGFAAEETRAAFSTDLAANTGNFAARFAAGHGQWVSAVTLGEQRRARELASAFLKEAEDAGRVVEAGVARRGLAVACYLSGDFLEARTHCERALAACDPEREKETRERFTDDTGPVAMSVLAMTMWQLGEVEKARELIDEANRRARDLGHAPSMAHPLNWTSRLEILRGDAAAALIAAEELDALCREHGMPLWRVNAELKAGWARGRVNDATAGAEDLRLALAAATDQGMMRDAWFYTALLAQLEAQTLGADSALARIDEALVLARRVDDRCDLPFAHILRGELLLKCDPSNPAPADQAFQIALEIAREQGARSWGLRAALSLTKLYQSTGRVVEAYDVLAPALEGLAPTAEMPEIAEAQTLLAALAETDEVKADAARRRRITQLQAAYGAALIAARGFGAPETTEAFARARDFAAGDNSLERLAADYGLWVGSYVRGDLPAMKAQAAAFLADVAAKPDSGEAGVAHRVQGMTHLFAGEFVEARRELKHALAVFLPGRDDDLAVRFPPDPGAAAMIYLVFALWALAEFDEVASLMERMRARVEGQSHATSFAHAMALTAFFALMRGDRSQVGRCASKLGQIVRDHELPLFQAIGEFLAGWATADGGSLVEGLEAMRRGVESARRQNTVVFDGLIKIALAEAEARVGDPERAVAVLDEALATSERTGHRAFEAELHRVRGEMLLKRDPANSAPAEKAFQTAIAVA